MRSRDMVAITGTSEFFPRRYRVMSLLLLLSRMLNLRLAEAPDLRVVGIGPGSGFFFRPPERWGACASRSALFLRVAIDALARDSRHPASGRGNRPSLADFIVKVWWAGDARAPTGRRTLPTAREDWALLATALGVFFGRLRGVLVDALRQLCRVGPAPK